MDSDKKDLAGRSTWDLGVGGHLVCIFTKLITKFEFVGARKPEDLPSIFKECDDRNDGGGDVNCNNDRRSSGGTL